MVLGALFRGLLALAVGRAQKKLDLLLGILFDDPLHPATVIDPMAGGRSRIKYASDRFPPPRRCRPVKG